MCPDLHVRHADAEPLRGLAFGRIDPAQQDLAILRRKRRDRLLHVTLGIKVGQLRLGSFRVVREPGTELLGLVGEELPRPLPLPKKPIAVVAAIR